MIIGSTILFHETLSSTNTEAQELLRKGEPPEGSVVYTDYQTSGRGQAGNKWVSEKGKNLLFSIILYPQVISPGNQFLISIFISLGLCDFLERHTGDVRIKWPNDIYVRNDKIAGILIENSLMGETIENSVAGIGVNLNQDGFSSDGIKAISLKMASGKEYNNRESLNELLRDLDHRYKQMLYGDPLAVMNDYLSRLYRYREWHIYRSDKELFEGRITRVLPDGKLQVENRAGSVSEYSFKEISFTG